MEAKISPMAWGLVFRKTEKLDILTHLRHKDEPPGTGHPADGIEVPCGVVTPGQSSPDAMLQRLREKANIVKPKSVKHVGTVEFPLKEDCRHDTHIYFVDVTGIESDFMPQGKYLEKINPNWGVKWLSVTTIKMISQGLVSFEDRQVKLGQPIAWEFVLSKIDQEC